MSPVQCRVRGTGIHRVGELVGKLGISPDVFTLEVQWVELHTDTLEDVGLRYY